MEFVTSALFKLNTTDLLKGIVVAVAAVVLAALQQALTAHGLDFLSYDWGGIFNLAITADVAYLSKNFLSDNKGAVLGKFGGTQQ